MERHAPLTVHRSMLHATYFKDVPTNNRDLAAVERLQPDDDPAGFRIEEPVCRRY